MKIIDANNKSVDGQLTREIGPIHIYLYIVDNKKIINTPLPSPRCMFSLSFCSSASLYHHHHNHTHTTLCWCCWCKKKSQLQLTAKVIAMNFVCAVRSSFCSVFRLCCWLFSELLRKHSANNKSCMRIWSNQRVWWYVRMHVSTYRYVILLLHAGLVLNFRSSVASLDTNSLFVGGKTYCIVTHFSFIR